MAVQSETHRLHFADGGLADAEDQLAHEIATLLRPTDVIFTPWAFDGHPDHEATARAVSGAAQRTQAAAPIEMPIWGWHWSEPNGHAIPWDRAVKVWLDDAARAAKRQAIQAFESQLTSRYGRPPILPPHVVRRFDRLWEVFFR